MINYYYYYFKIPIEWEEVDVKPTQLADGRVGISEAAIEQIRQNKIGLKGPLATPIGRGHVSLNLTLRRTLNLYANVRPCRSIRGFEAPVKGAPPYRNVDLVVIRENTEGEYSGIEHEVVAGVVQSVKLITKAASERIAQYAFQQALQTGRNHVTVVHKASIMYDYYFFRFFPIFKHFLFRRMSDGLFLKVAKDICEREYPTVGFAQVSLDNACMQVCLKACMHLSI